MIIIAPAGGRPFDNLHHLKRSCHHSDIFSLFILYLALGFRIPDSLRRGGLQPE